MELWNDYVGRIIAEAYPLQKLLSPEGRSAFFTTSNGTGTPSIIRLIEPHFDEAEILSRWRQVQELHQPNLITLRKYGETLLDGTNLVYAVMEPTDSSLADILRERPLTVEETRQVAVSLVAALLALHARNLVHEHIDPSNIFAAGEVVKLRSDCVREAPEGQAGIDLKTRDVHDLAIVLLRCLTLQTSIPSTPLPAFNDVIRHGIDGTWSLAHIAATVAPPASSKPRPSSSKPSAAESPTPRPAPSAAKTPSSIQAATAPQFIPTPPIAPDVRHRLVNSVEPLPLRLNLKLAVGLGAASLLIIFFLWHNLHSATPSTSNPTETTLAAASDPATAPINTVAPAPVAISPTSPAPASDTRSQWRVVAYTYNRQDQAQKKAGTLAAKHADLHPEVFTPTGRAPYLVVLGGPLTRDQAFVLRNQARTIGLAPDTYAQNYSR